MNNNCAGIPKKHYLQTSSQGFDAQNISIASSTVLMIYRNKCMGMYSKYKWNTACICDRNGSITRKENGHNFPSAETWDI